MNSSDPIVIVSCARTPMGGMQGDFATVTASELGGVAIQAALERGSVSADDVDEVIMGNVLPAGQGQAPARQAAWNAGIPRSAGATTINKMCGSGRQRRCHGCWWHGKHDQCTVFVAQYAKWSALRPYRGL